MIASMLGRVAGRLRPALRPSLPARRALHATPRCLHGDFEWEDPKSPDDVVNIIYIDRNGGRWPIAGKVGDNLLYLTHRWHKQHPELALEGACEASLACSTCHVIVDDEHFELLPEADEEARAPRAAAANAGAHVAHRAAFSRAGGGHARHGHVPLVDESTGLPDHTHKRARWDRGDVHEHAWPCPDPAGQRTVTTLHGPQVTLPAYSKNFYVDGHVPEPH